MPCQILPLLCRKYLNEARKFLRGLDIAIRQGTGNCPGKRQNIVNVAFMCSDMTRNYDRAQAGEFRETLMRTFRLGPKGNIQTLFASSCYNSVGEQVIYCIAKTRRNLILLWMWSVTKIMGLHYTRGQRHRTVWTKHFGISDDDLNSHQWPSGQMQFSILLWTRSRSYSGALLFDFRCSIFLFPYSVHSHHCLASVSIDRLTFLSLILLYELDVWASVCCVQGSVA